VVTKRLEDSRAAGAIGSSLQAEVVVGTEGADRALLDSLGDDLKFVFITSKAAVKESAGEIVVDVVPSAATKCERCWHWREDVGANARYATLCARCVANLEGPGEARVHA